jgi:tRNA(fMet)-specific endonuclease VapC
MILDTNALSAWADKKLSNHNILWEAENLVIPVIVLGEFLFGIQQSRDREEYEDFLNKISPIVAYVDITPKTARIYSKIRQALKNIGKPIPANDTWIAAIAHQLDEPILTNDKHFNYIQEIEKIGY